MQIQEYMSIEWFLGAGTVEAQEKLSLCLFYLFCRLNLSPQSFYDYLTVENEIAANTYMCNYHTPSLGWFVCSTRLWQQG